MSSLLDKSLDDIVAQDGNNTRRRPQRQSQRGQRGAQRTMRRGPHQGRNFTSTPYVGTGMYPSAMAPMMGVQPGLDMGLRGNTDNKIMVSNLAYKVTRDDLFELFSQIGPVRKVTVNCNEDGRSLGTATVSFKRASDPARAVSTYDQVTLDGRPMAIGIVQSAAAASPVYPMQAATPMMMAAPYPTRAARQSRPYDNQRNRRQQNQTRGDRRQTKPESQTKTADDLDAEMDAYMGGQD
ncbi:RNA-binding RNA annealing protein [Dispira parvispora]|uniref:RNA-binding RNA annealing protein n=1 Tax=Dispira parvispora TaxID=1520584 RepID=A0A9W8E8T9_9FUNG|nr:RNA-binding RNA annealing protein [Dispira parvispora]